MPPEFVTSSTTLVLFPCESQARLSHFPYARMITSPSCVHGNMYIVEVFPKKPPFWLYCCMCPACFCRRSVRETRPGLRVILIIVNGKSGHRAYDRRSALALPSGVPRLRSPTPPVSHPQTDFEIILKCNLMDFSRYSLNDGRK